jgi:S1-C subfamily serine protease
MIWRAMYAAYVAVLIAGAANAAESNDKRSDEDLQQRLEAAQERLDEAAREVAELSMALSEDAVPFIKQFRGAMGRRAVLGINIGSGSEAADGVEVISVSPGGPAARAGLQAGDVLTRIDDVVLKRDEERGARAKLLQRLRAVEPGEAVKLEYRRGEQKRTAEIKTEAPGKFDFVLPAPPLAHGAPGAMFFGHSAGAFGAAEIVPLTKQLGRYFGTEEGLLLVRAPRDERLELEDGDVLLDIDGRKPTSPSHALRILGSYQAGETVKINVLRLKKRVTLDVTVPERTEAMEGRLWRERPMRMPLPAPSEVEPPL